MTLPFRTMRLLSLVTALLAALPLLANVVVFRNVNVVPMTSPKIAGKQTVLVRNGRIEAVGKNVKTPKDAKVIDGQGQYLMPGLAEMHGHVPPAGAPSNLTEDTLFLYVANGITTVRGMLGHPGQLELRERSRNGEIVSPNLYLAGPSFNGTSINSVQDAIDKAKAQKAEGWDLLKVHPGLSRDEYDALARTAREIGIRFAGHVPEEVGLLRALESGHETFDHIDGYVEFVGGDKGPADQKKLAEAVRISKAKGVWIVPTSALWEVLYSAVPLETLRAYPELKYVPAKSVDLWSKMYEDRLKQIPRATAANVMASRREILGALHKGGVKILMGTDAPQQFSVPGFSLHRELQRMKDAGMSNYAILESGTVNVGQYFAKQDKFGTIAPGQRADLVLVDGNPLTDLANVRKISGVMVDGRWFSRADLDAGLKKIEARFKRQ